MIASIAPFLELAVVVIVIGATLFLRYAIVALNQDMREILERQGKLREVITIGFEAQSHTNDMLNKRIKTLEDEVL